ncbi:Uncharacterized protein FWK35_00027729, partial [Aphis craccivora]
MYPIGGYIFLDSGELSNDNEDLVELSDVSCFKYAPIVLADVKRIFSKYKSRRIFAKRVQRVLAYRHIMYWRGIQFALCVRTTRKDTPFTNIV